MISWLFFPALRSLRPKVPKTAPATGIAMTAVKANFQLMMNMTPSSASTVRGSRIM